MINWLALEGPLPYPRLTAEVGDGQTADTDRLELVLELSTNGSGLGPLVRKQVRMNGVAKRGLDLIGRLRVVLFLPEDVSLVAGAPGERRRYLDIALCQIDHSYCRALTEYNKVLAQRNALLKQLRDEGGDAGQLAFWDEQMAEHGARVLGRRAPRRERPGRPGADSAPGAVGRLRVAGAHLPAQPGAARWGRRAARRRRMACAYAETPLERIAELLAAHLRAQRSRDIAAGATLSGSRTATTWPSSLTAATCALTAHTGSSGPRCWPRSWQKSR